MKVTLREGEASRLLAIAHPITKQLKFYRFKPNVIHEIPDIEANLITDRRFIVFGSESPEPNKADKKSKKTNTKTEMI